MKKHFGTRRPRLLRSLMSVMAVALVALGLPLVTMSAASAHNAYGTATCDGITSTTTNYNGSYKNSLEIWIDGVLKYSNYNFGSGITVSVPVPKDDGITHTWRRKIFTPEPGGTNFNHDDSGTVGPCGFKHVTANLWTVSPPTCDKDGVLVPATTEPEGITASQSPAGTGPGHYTITFTPKPGFAIDGPKNQDLTVLAKGDVSQCAVVTPVTPTITHPPTCTGPGTHSDGTFALPPNGGGITYSADQNVVTAVTDVNHKFANLLPTGWTRVNDHKATYTVTYPNPGLCLVPVPVPTPPAATKPTCNVDGSLTVVPTEHVLTTVDGKPLAGQASYGPGDHTITYAPAPGYTFGDQVVEPTVVTVLEKTGNCPASVVSPTVTQSVCTGQGTHSDPVVKLGDVEGDHVSYKYDAASHVVTATPDTGYALANLPTGWTLQENRTATYVVTLTDPGTCLVTVVSPPTTSPVVQVQPPKAHHPMVLPNTGGPNQWLALAGLVLLLGGGALVSRERRLRRSEG